MEGGASLGLGISTVFFRVHVCLGSNVLQSRLDGAVLQSGRVALRLGPLAPILTSEG